MKKAGRLQSARNKNSGTRTVPKVSTKFKDREGDSVRVRMYRHGLGECFLLTFPRLGMPFYMLIDCGAVGSPKMVKKLTDVAQDVKQVTQGRLDVLVVTHPHRDKVSGFLAAKEIFDGMDVGQVWMSWTEDPNDPDSRSLEEGRFASPLPNARAMEYVRKLGRRVIYWRGGQGPVGLSGVSGVRIFFLGPPTLHADLSRAQSAIRFDEPYTQRPFSDAYRISIEAAKQLSKFAGYFGVAGKNDQVEPGSMGETAWRQISETLQASTPRLNLRSPAAINDTSVVMAIELRGLGKESKVLLFPGDAQIASWFSWHEHHWPADASPEDPETVSCRKLLERTVLYKASNYGGRAGTPAQFGLDMMSSPDLVAMIAGNEAVAKKLFRWQLPSPDLMKALEDRTRGRIIRADLGVSSSMTDKGMLTMVERAEFEKAVRATDLYIDYYVTIPQQTAEERGKLADNWSAANERRVYLVDKKLAGTIRPEEESELREIEKLMEEYLTITAPTGSGLLAELREVVASAKRSVVRRK